MNQKKIISTIEAKDIIFGSDQDKSTFTKGVSHDKKRLSIKITSDSPFTKGARMKLKLIGVLDNTGVFTRLEMKSHLIQRQDSNQISFDFVGDIPVPFGVYYLPTIVQKEEEFELQPGVAIEYRFVLRVRDGSTLFRIPLTARYRGAEAKMDFKCERLEVMPTRDDTFHIRVLSGSTVFYAREPHCVSHGQAPKPIVFYHEI